ncbi:Uncharacterized conserved protein YbjT, contains NAD(P)-binding and DUF2867 domains [Mucilaginibacter pineti]|uniref:Uncharacterized conserved protein YbjT, contains NAD(P)-binding and DUF2867 domains n=1 Tax=Mucilaginibacter pineti TaxID=1391627 RepID=A0A1G6ZCA9_9SPHI|nr:NAD(P)H-binding protein [Mucilaginibacter pineti]SDD99515.1 Uncharacterized conserved protein YbjT, contains NAD(P)-binding and DUF2867 domains [Mucilaginibacter pineti]
MKIIITGSTGNISKPLTSLLVEEGHDVSVITSNENKAAEIEELGASPLIGSVEGADFIKNAFQGADAVYTMIPPNMTSANWKEYIYGVGNNYAQAAKAAGVKKVVNLSAVGADVPKGGGLTSLYYYVEQELNKLEDVAVVHLRPGSFYFNFFGNIDMIKHMGIIGNNYNADVLPLTHPLDISQAAFEELSALNFNGKRVRYVVSDELSTKEIAEVLGEAIGKPDLQWVKFKDEDALHGMIQTGLTPDVAEILVEMGQGVESGIGLAEYLQNKPTFSVHKFKDFAKVFAAAYANS